MEMCHEILCQMSKHEYYWPGNRWSLSRHHSLKSISHLSSNCTLYKEWQASFNWKYLFCKCQQDTDSGQSTKIYTKKELVMMETTISNFHTSVYIPEIQKLAFHIPQVQILGTNHCGGFRRTAFKRRESFQYVLCRRDYAERVVASFSTKYNYNIMVEIDLCLLRVFYWNISVHCQINK